MSRYSVWARVVVGVRLEIVDTEVEGIEDSIPAAIAHALAGADFDGALGDNYSAARGIDSTQYDEGTNPLSVEVRSAPATGCFLSADGTFWKLDDAGVWIQIAKTEAE